MSRSEKLFATIKDVLLPLDPGMRYDLYFTDGRIAIVCMGRLDREPGKLPYSPLYGIAPTAPPSESRERVNKVIIEEEIDNLSLDDKLKLSKKSSYYTYNEIEEVKLVSGSKLKIVILSKEYISKFSPNKEQFKQLSDLLPTIDAIKDKLSISGNWQVIQEEVSSVQCTLCSSQNDSDAYFCQNCGNKIREKPTQTEFIKEKICSSCGKSNKMQVSFCKNCGAPFG